MQKILIGLMALLASFGAFAADVDLTPLTSSISVAGVIAGILAIALLAAGVRLTFVGARAALRALGWIG